MSEKSILWAELKEAGATDGLDYASSTVEQLHREVSNLRAASDFTDFAQAPAEKPAVPETTLPPRPHVPTENPRQPGRSVPQPTTEPATPAVAGVPEEYVYTDEQGRMWLQREVRKPQTAQPRGRRKVTYTDPGVGESVTVSDPDGRYTETYEMPGHAARVEEAKVTLPSYQVGIYRHPSLPFKVHCYNDQEGYDLLEVWEYYNGETRVPKECLRKYVSNSLVYDIASVNQAIMDEDNRNRLYATRQGAQA